MLQYSVRRLKSGEEQALVLAASQGAPPPVRAAFPELLASVMEHEPQGVFVAEANRLLVGCVVARQRQVHPWRGGKYGQIACLWVAPALDGAAAERRLLVEAEAYLKSRGCLSVQFNLPVGAPVETELFKAQGYRVGAWQLERSL